MAVFVWFPTKATVKGAPRKGTPKQVGTPTAESVAVFAKKCSRVVWSGSGLGF